MVQCRADTRRWISAVYCGLVLQLLEDGQVRLTWLPCMPAGYSRTKINYQNVISDSFCKLAFSPIKFSVCVTAQTDTLLNDWFVDRELSWPEVDVVPRGVSTACIWGRRTFVFVERKWWIERNTVWPRAKSATSEYVSNIRAATLFDQFIFVCMNEKCTLRLRKKWIIARWLFRGCGDVVCCWRKRHLVCSSHNHLHNDRINMV